MEKEVERSQRYAERLQRPLSRQDTAIVIRIAAVKDLLKTEFVNLTAMNLGKGQAELVGIDGFWEQGIQCL